MTTGDSSFFTASTDVTLALTRDVSSLLNFNLIFKAHILCFTIPTHVNAQYASLRGKVMHNTGFETQIAPDVSACLFHCFIQCHIVVKASSSNVKSIHLRVLFKNCVLYSNS